MDFINIFLHIDKTLITATAEYGVSIYIILFLIIFIETGIVAFPFLPGDSLLFAVGALSAVGSLDVRIVSILLTVAAVSGDSVNYLLGKKFGERLFQDPNSKFFKKEYLDRTVEFYAMHGTKAVVAGRFFPVIRTFVPFVAGIGAMDYKKFIFYNIIGGIIWVTVFLFAGFFFGNIPFVKDNFTLVVFGIVILSILPAARKALW
ncbi:MAG: DedA family protein [Candidatus Vogelbacteria bacterium]|nr:DedA family protein [Candidatus Vogelbacteria bacterium]